MQSGAGDPDRELGVLVRDILGAQGPVAPEPMRDAHAQFEDSERREERFADREDALFGAVLDQTRPRAEILSAPLPV